MAHSDIIQNLVNKADHSPGYLQLKALPAYERIEVLAQAIGEVGRQLETRRGTAARDSSVHTLNYLNTLLSEEF